MEMYVLQVKPNTEETVKYELMKKGFKIISPTAEIQERYCGQWHSHIKTIFTQYVFIECDLSDEVYYKVKSVPEVIRFLGHGKPQKLPADEWAYINILGNNGKPIKPSKVYTTANGDKMIMSGILRKYADKIVFLDLRQRKARIEIMLCGKVHRITLPIIGI